VNDAFVASCSATQKWQNCEGEHCLPCIFMPFKSGKNGRQLGVLSEKQISLLAMAYLRRGQHWRNANVISILFLCAYALAWTKFCRSSTETWACKCKLHKGVWTDALRSIRIFLQAMTGLF